MNSWGKWGKCSKTCGPGTHSRSRTVKLAAKNGGAACGAKTESRNCQDKPCPLPCKGLGFIKADLKGKRTTVPAFANGCCILENANFYAPFDNVIKCKKSSDCCKAADIRGDPNYRMHQRAKPYAAKSYWDIDYECRHVAVAGGKICVPSIDPST